MFVSCGRKGCHEDGRKYLGQSVSEGNRMLWSDQFCVPGSGGVDDFGEESEESAELIWGKK